MTQDHFPKDIMETAEKTLDRMLCNCSGSTDNLRKDSILELAQALYAERLSATSLERDRVVKIWEKPNDSL